MKNANVFIDVDLTLIDASGRLLEGAQQGGFEEALRAFYRREQQRFSEFIAPWPKDVRDHVKKLVALASPGPG